MAIEDSIHGAPLPMVDLEIFVPDIMNECPAAPIPLIERRLREAMVEACERANIVRWQAPELPTRTDKICYDVPVPNEHTQVHSIVRAYLNRNPIPNIPPIETLDNVYNQINNHGRGYFVPNRGQLQFTHPPGTDSDPFELGSAFNILTICDPDVTAAEILTACGVLPTDPGAIGPAVPAEFDIDASEVLGTGGVFSLGNTRFFHGGGASGSKVAVIDEAHRAKATSGVWYWETELDSYTNPTSNGAQFAGIAQDAPADDFTSGASTRVIGVQAGVGSSNSTAVVQAGATIFTRVGSPLAETDVLRHVLDVDAGTYSVAANGEALETVATSLTGVWFPYVESGRSGSGLIGASWILRTVSTQFTEAVPTGAQVFGNEEVTQLDIDAYNLALVSYNNCVAALNACLTDPGAFTGVDPGPVDPGNPATYDTTTFVTGLTANIDFTDGDTTATYNTTASNVIMKMQPDGVAPEDTIDLTAGKYIWNVLVNEPTAQFPGLQIGVGDDNGFYSVNGVGWSVGGGIAYDCGTGDIHYVLGGSVQTLSTGVSIVAGDIVTVQLDLDAYTIEFFVNGVSINTPFDLNTIQSTPTEWSPLIGMRGSGVGNPLASATMQFGETQILAAMGLTALPTDYQTMGTPAVTQQEVDDYNDALAAHAAAVVAYDAQQAEIAAAQASSDIPRASFGLELFITLKPTRECDYVPKVLYDDYYNLVISGALSKLLKMHETPWQDHAYAQQKEIEFEHEIARAKQQIDRGFTTKPNRLRPRRFV